MLVSGGRDRACASLVPAHSGDLPAADSIALNGDIKMPNRVIRGALLSSNRWLGLRDNSGRVCFVALLLSADDVGNMEGSIPHLRRLWRDYGVDTDEKVSRTLTELVDCDLARLYESGGKQFIHIPRFNQFLRFLKRRNPPSPWDDNQKIQRATENSQRESNAIAALQHPEVKRSEEKRREVEHVVQDSTRSDDAVQKAKALAEKMQGRNPGST